MKSKILTLLVLLLSQLNFGQNLPQLRVSDDSSYIVTESGRPFFWLGGTAWEMIHRLDKEQIDLYLEDRAEKGFTVVQTVILAELDGLNTPNAYGEKPLIDNDPEQINEKYFELVDYVVKKAGEEGLYVGLLPTWGDKFNRKWGAGPEIFNESNAESFGKILAKRYLPFNNIIWILGGDRIPENENHYAIIRSMAKGIRNIDNKHLITYHPVGTNIASDFFDDPWLDLDMFQSGHSSTANEYSYISKSREAQIRRPVINGEARYEDIPDRFWEDKYYGWLDDADVRVSAYWSIIAGAAGYTYGCNDIWQMFETGRDPVIQARTDWPAAIELPGSSQMKYMKEIFEALPWQNMVHDQSLILNNNPKDASYILSAIGEEKDFMIAYTPEGKPVEPDLSQISDESITAWWYNPRSGKILQIGRFDTDHPQVFDPWSKGKGSDFLLIIAGEDSDLDFSVFE